MPTSSHPDGGCRNHDKEGRERRKGREGEEGEEREKGEEGEEEEEEKGKNEVRLVIPQSSRGTMSVEDQG